MFPVKPSAKRDGITAIPDQGALHDPPQGRRHGWHDHGREWNFRWD